MNSSDLEDRLSQDDVPAHFAYPGHMIRYTPQEGDPGGLAGLVVRAAISLSETEVNDVEDVDALAEWAEKTLPKRPLLANHGIYGVHLKVQEGQLLISIPDGEPLFPRDVAEAVASRLEAGSPAP